MTTKKANMKFPTRISFRGYNPKLEPDDTEIEWASTLLSKAKKPVIMAGGGIIASGASNELINLAETLIAPVTTSLMGKGAIPSDHQLSLGLCGMHGRSEANYVVPDADVLLVVGARFSDRTTGSLHGFAPNARIIHIDLDKSEIDKNVDSITRVVGDARIALRELTKKIQMMRLKEGRNGEWIKKIQEFKQCEISTDEINISGPGVIKAIRNALPRNAVVTTDVGQHQMWAAIHFDVYEPGSFNTSGGLGTMGWGTPAAIGAKVAKPNVPVLNIAGDGSFAMTENNLAVSVDEDLPIIIVIFNNGMLGMVAQWQRLFMDHRYSAVHRNYSLDFAKLAESYGAEGVKVESMNELNTALRRAVNSEHTVVIDVPIDPEENVYPMIPPGMGLKDILTEDEMT
jgi:acetolactate synthase-1/2/3 large subunit